MKTIETQIITKTSGTRNILNICHDGENLLSTLHSFNTFS